MADKKKEDARMYDIQHMGGGTVVLFIGRKVERDESDGLAVVKDEGKIIRFGPGPGLTKFAVVFDGAPEHTVRVTESQWTEMQALRQVQDLVKRNLLVARLAA